MKRSTLSGYENEVAEPGIQALMAFSKYFGVAVDTRIRSGLFTETAKDGSAMKHLFAYLRISTCNHFAKHDERVLSADFLLPVHGPVSWAIN